MCKLIAELVGTDRALVREIINRLEKRSAMPGVDVRLTGEIYGAAHMKARALGLDPHDSTAEELYHALLNTTKLHDEFLAKRFHVQGADNNVVIEKCVQITQKLNVPSEAWALKPSSVRAILERVPPRNLQKLLGYRSLDSLLKREQPQVLLAAAKFTEPQSWQQKLSAQYKKLSSLDFTTQKLQVTFLGQKKWHKAASLIAHKSHAHVVTSHEAGAVLALPVPGSQKPGLTLLTFVIILHAFNEIRMYGSFFKFHHMQPNFGGWLVDALQRGHGQHVRIAGQDIHWRSVHRHFGRKDAIHPRIFQPHIQPEDIAYRRAESVLFHLEPALYFWHDLDYVGWPRTSGPVSFNLMDNLINLVNDLPYQQRVHYHLQQAVWDELYARYLGQASLETALIDELDSRVVSEPVLADVEFSL